MSGTLGSLLQKASSKSTSEPTNPKGKRINDVSDLFSKQKTVLAEPVIVEETKEDVEGENPFIDEEMTAKQKQDRDDRTIFVGNIALAATSQQIAKEFKEYGKIEKIWIRSLPIEESKMPKKASVILKQFKEGVDKKNAYILFSTLEEAQKSLGANGKLFLEKHLRVDSANSKILDYTKTVFVGNLHFKISEETVRKHFEDCGEILNVRVIRDPATHDGKGFGYVLFKEREAFLNALQKNGSELLKREIRVKKAVTAERLEKKRVRTEQKAVSVNKMNAVSRLKKKLDSKAVVQDNEELNVKGAGPRKQFRSSEKSPAGQREFKPKRTESSTEKRSQSEPKKPFAAGKKGQATEKKAPASKAPEIVKKAIRKDKATPTTSNGDKNIFNGAKGSRDAQRKNRQAHGKKQGGAGKKPFGGKPAGANQKKQFKKNKPQ